MSRPSTTSARRTQKSEYIETDTGNKISRRSHIEGKSNIMLGGKTVIMAGAIIRGDLAKQPDPLPDGKIPKAITAITIGRPTSGTIICPDVVLRPPMRMVRGQMAFYPIRIGDNVFVGPGTHVSALSISSNVHISPDCVLSPFTVVKENCKIITGTVLPHSMVVPPGSIVAGNPGQIIGEVGDAWGQGGGGEGEEWIEGGDLRALVRSIK